MVNLLTNVNVLSVNQMNAQIKLTEVWKALHNKNSPLNIKIPIFNPEHQSARSKGNGRLINKVFSNGTKLTFLHDSKKNWNCAPENIRKCEYLHTAKLEIKKFIKTKFTSLKTVE